MLLGLQPRRRACGGRGKDAEQIDIDVADGFDHAADQAKKFQRHSAHNPEVGPFGVPRRLFRVPALLVLDALG
jgi:hypothetical protein